MTRRRGRVHDDEVVGGDRSQADRVRRIGLARPVATPVGVASDGSSSAPMHQPALRQHAEDFLHVVASELPPSS